MSSGPGIGPCHVRDQTWQSVSIYLRGQRSLLQLGIAECKARLFVVAAAGWSPLNGRHSLALPASKLLPNASFMRRKRRRSCVTVSEHEYSEDAYGQQCDAASDCMLTIATDHSGGASRVVTKVAVAISRRQRSASLLNVPLAALIRWVL
jgi:hypothetical protein